MTDKSCDTCRFHFAQASSVICSTCARGDNPDYPNWQDNPALAKFAERESTNDPVKSPSHYQLLPGVEVIDVRKALLDKMQPAGWTHYQSDCWSRSWEYLTRAMAKNGLEDLKKARTYLNWLIESLEKMG
jgi:hypothetical protein